MGPSGEGVVELALDPAVKYVLTVQPTPPLPNRSFPIQTSTKVLKKTKSEICTFTSTDSYGLRRHTLLFYFLVTSAALSLFLLFTKPLLAARSVQGREHNFYLIIIADLRRVLPLHRKWCQQRLMTMFEWKQHFTCLWKCPKCDWKPLKRKHGSLSISDISRDSSLRLQGSTRSSRLQ